MYIPPEELLTIAHTLDFTNSDFAAMDETCLLCTPTGIECSKCRYNNYNCMLFYNHNPDLQQSIDDFKQLYPEYFI